VLAMPALNFAPWQAGAVLGVMKKRSGVMIQATQQEGTSKTFTVISTPFLSF